MELKYWAFALSPLLMIPTAFIVISALPSVDADEPLRLFANVLAAAVTCFAIAITLMVAASWVDVRRL